MIYRQKRLILLAASLIAVVATVFLFRHLRENNTTRHDAKMVAKRASSAASRQSALLSSNKTGVRRVGEHSRQWDARGENARADNTGLKLEEGVVAEKVKEWLREPWNHEAFEKGLALLKDRSLSPASRILVLDKLNSKRRQLDPGEMQSLLIATRLLAKDPTQETALAARAVRAMASQLILMQEQGLLTRVDIRGELPFLTDLAKDAEADLILRGQAIRALGNLQAQDASPLLRAILADPTNLNKPEISRNVCLALGQLEGNAAIAPIASVLSTTTDESVFGSAAFALGQLQTSESVIALVQNAERFPNSASPDAALVNMEDAVFNMLQNVNDPNIASAISATRHLWKDGQRDKYIPQLRAVLSTAPLPARKAAAERLIQDASTLPFETEKQELQKILPTVSGDPELAEYTQHIQRRLAAKLLVPTGNTVPVVARPRGGQ